MQGRRGHRRLTPEGCDGTEVVRRQCNGSIGRLAAVPAPTDRHERTTHTVRQGRQESRRHSGARPQLRRGGPPDPGGTGGRQHQQHGGGGCRQGAVKEQTGAKKKNGPKGAIWSWRRELSSTFLQNFHVNIHSVNAHLIPDVQPDRDGTSGVGTFSQRFCL